MASEFSFFFIIKSMQAWLKKVSGRDGKSREEEREMGSTCTGLGRGCVRWIVQHRHMRVQRRTNTGHAGRHGIQLRQHRGASLRT